MKKIVFLLIIIFLFLHLYSNNNNKNITVFSYQEKEKFDNYYIKFKDCDLNTNNFIEKLDYLNDKDFKILEIIPTNSLNETYMFYTKDLKKILDEFKNKYISLITNDSKYTTNICIEQIKINTSNYILNELSNNIDFTY